jgi:15-cis-phytoene synthase
MSSDAVAEDRQAMAAGGRPADVRRYDPEARLVMARVARTFDLATRLLPAPTRTDVRRLYLVLRSLDDAVDHGHPDAAARIAAVEAWAAGATVTGREAELLEDLASRHPALPREAILDFCMGMRADLAGPRHATDADLATYCYQVAGTVGRLMAVLVGVQPGREADADGAARALGRAMQRTNIIRDVVEDARSGRVYLAWDELRELGMAGDPGTWAASLATLASWPADRRRALLADQVRRADADYALGLAGVPSLVRGRRAITAAALMYREILRAIERDGFGGSGRRVVVSRPRKAAIVIRAVVRGR